MSLAPVKPRLASPFWYWLTQVVLEKRPLNGCSISKNDTFKMLQFITAGLAKIIQYGKTNKRNQQQCNKHVPLSQCGFVHACLPPIPVFLSALVEASLSAVSKQTSQFHFTSYRQQKIIKLF